jgi:flagellar hook-associated protein 1 FlgK
MSISSALSNALSGLTSAARAADVVSSNTANVMTAGYARRELAVSSRAIGGTGAGVWVDGIVRIVNQAILTDRRLADAEAGNAGARTAFLTGIEALIGAPGEAGSLAGRLAGFESALIEAASRPDSEARLATVLRSAQSLAGRITTLAAATQQARMDADQSIAGQVQMLNDSLVQIDRLNAEIMAQRAAGGDAAALIDQRQVLVDRVAEIVPVREAARDHGQISLYTTGGALLLEGNPAEIGFAAAGVITADMTMASGALSGLTINGMAVSTADSGLFGGGTLGAAFSQRDELAPQLQVQLDAFARDLISRFEAAGVDSTLPAGAAGLFTDAGSALDISAETGLAGRISLNALVDPAQGGALWRLRDGLGAASPGDVGDARLLNAFKTALTEARAPASGNFIGAARSASGLAADILSQISSARQTAEDQHSYAAARQEALTALQLADGVDTDHEMQMLLQIERAYAANARVLKTVDEMIQQIMAI